ncbi:MAG: hypothetical protein JO023_25820 [Chloroflexi bacterium]|nr:hypothetical protein [Chloroflexota bacterium]
MTGSILLLESDAALSDILSEALREEQLTVVPYTRMSQLLAAVEAGEGDVAVLNPSAEEDLLPGATDDQPPVSIADRIPTIILSTYAWTDKFSAEDLGVVAVIAQPTDLDPLCSLIRRAAQHAHELRQREARLRDQASLTWSGLARAHDRISDSRALVRAMRARLAGGSSGTA